MPDQSTGFWGSLAGILTGIAGVVAAVTGLYVAFKPSPVPAPPPRGTEGPRSALPRMGPLQYNVGYDHNDLNPSGWQSMASPEACSDLCYANERCKAMTYVITNRTCWLKFAAENRISNDTEVSAIRLDR